MSTRVETRRSSKRMEPAVSVDDSPYGTRSALKTPKHANNLESPLSMTRKRQRDDTVHRRSPSVRRGSAITINDDKRTKADHEALDGLEIRAHRNQAKDDKVASEGIGGLPADATKKKRITPAMERMKGLQDRFARLVQALLRSQMEHVDQKLVEIKKGTCPELNDEYRPLAEQHERRLLIAEKKLALQKAEADRQWNAARTSAQYAFINGRAELRSKTRQMLSNQIFDLSREYRELNVDISGMPQTDLERQRYKVTNNESMPGPMSATLTEKDEDFLLMDMPAPKLAPFDAEVTAAAPILETLTQHALDPAQIETIRPQPKTGHSRSQKSRRLVPAGTEHRAPMSTTSSRVKAVTKAAESTQEANQLLSINNLLSSNKSRTEPHQVKPSARVEPQTTSNGHGLVNIAPRKSTQPLYGGDRLPSTSYDQAHQGNMSSHFPVPSFIKQAHTAPPDTISGPYGNSSNLGTVSVPYTPWPPRQQQERPVDQTAYHGNYGPPQGYEGPNGVSGTGYARNRGSLGYNPESSSNPPFFSHSAVQQSGPTFKSYVDPHYDARMQNPPMHQTSYQQRPGGSGNQIVPNQMLPPLPRAQVSAPTLLHPFRRSEAYNESPAYSPATMNGHSDTYASPFNQYKRANNAPGPAR